MTNKNLIFDKYSNLFLIYFLIGTLILILVLVIAVDDNYLFITSGILSLLIVCFPIVVKNKIDLFEPIIFVVLSVFIGVTARSFYLVYSNNNTQIKMLLNNEPINILVEHSLWMPVGLLFFVVGYMTVNKRIMLEKINFIKNDNWNIKRLLIICSVTSVISLLGVFLYVKSANIQITNMASLSVRRLVELESNSGVVRYAQLGYFRFLSSISLLSLYLLFVHYLSSAKKMPVLIKVLSIVIGLISITIPFLTNSRSLLIIIFFNIIGFMYYRRKFNIIKYVSFTIIALTIVVVMGELRKINSHDDLTVFENLNQNVIEKSIDNLVGSGNFISIGRTNLIIARVPESFDYLYGISYLTWITGWVPKELWPDKPEISTGLLVRKYIYGMKTRVGGFPPGMIGEAYMNFGYIGIPIICFIIGAILKLYYNTFRPLIYKNKNILALYMSILWYMGFNSVGLNFSQFIINCLITFIPIFCMIYFISNKKMVTKNSLLLN